ncbi:MAG TPA: EAL domain-containing protein [Devosia sp.]|nr:EAL domain-containing protein [Devosia sp.]
MTAPQRIIALAIFGAFLAVYWRAPDLLSLDSNGLIARVVIVQIGGPLLAAIVCAMAARSGTASDRAAWTSFAAGSGFYVAGNLLYLFYTLNGVAVDFPALPEASFFVMAALFAWGMFRFGQVRQQITRLQVYNYILITCSVILASLFVLNQWIVQSTMAPFATVVAFLYPAIWFSVAVSGLISLVLYAQGGKGFAFALMVLAVFAEAIADFAYAQQLLSGTYVTGGETQLLWVASAALIVWAGFEHRAAAARGRDAPMPVRKRFQSIAEAAVPAVAVGLVLLSGSLTGALGGSDFVQLSTVLVVVFAVLSGLREHWIIRTQRNLLSSIGQSREALEKSQAQLAAVLESTSDSVLVLDRDWRVVYFNHHAVESIAMPDRLRLGITVWDLFPAAATSGEGARYIRAMETGQPAEFELFVEDRKVWLGINAYPSADGLSIFFRDISEQKRARDELQHMAEHDPLTGLANRALFQSRLKEMVDARANFAVILLDVDHFKEVNDTLGHPVGDSLLLATGERLAACLRPSDLVARLGGDEFVVIAEGAGAAEAARLAQRFHDTASAPHSIDGEQVRLGASMGIALSRGQETDPDRLFREADIALYAAKASGRGAFRIFEPSMEAGMQERQALRADLRSALANGELEIHYQPLVDLRTERVSSFEALLRWRHPTRGMVSPELFVPIAEDSGLIVEIGNWVLETACAEAVKWPREISLAVNLSTREFAGHHLAKYVARALKNSGLEAGRLELEITESVLLRNSRTNLETLHRLRGLGVRIALDDFGTGYSSLAYLQQFPFSKIKIDRSFVAGLPRSAASQAIVRSVIGLGMALGMRVTAEGVETKAQYDWVRLGCNEAQGFFIGRPSVASEVPTMIKEIGDRAAARNSDQERRAG